MCFLEAITCVSALKMWIWGDDMTLVVPTVVTCTVCLLSYVKDYRSALDNMEGSDDEAERLQASYDDLQHGTVRQPTSTVQSDFQPTFLQKTVGFFRYRPKRQNSS